MTNPSPFRAAPSGDFLSHVDAYIAHCRASGQSPRHVSQKRSHLRKFARESGVRLLADATLETLTANLSAMRDAGKSARTCNWRRQIVVCFLNWCVKTRRLDAHNANAAAVYDESDDQRRVRRALTDDECARLLAVADSRGASRSLWYRLALEVGLRRGELCRLRWADVDLDARVLTVRGSKAKRADVVPLLGDTAERLAELREPDDRPDCRVFPFPVSDGERRADFADARIAERDGRGRVADLHSLRTTLGTRLARRGVAPQVAQRIMRHRSYSTTLRHYTDLQLDDMRRALRGAHALPASAPGSSHHHGQPPVHGWLSTCPVPLSDPQRRAIAGVLSV